MKNQTSSTDKKRESIRYSSSFSIKDDSRERRRLEMKRRFAVLQSRRVHLERELVAIKAALFSLDQQMKSCTGYQQLSMNRQSLSLK